MAGYSTSVSGTTITISITPDPNYLYYYVVVRLTSDAADMTYREWHYYPTSAIQVTDLLPNTSYTINVGYGKDGNTTWGWYGAAQETTGSSGSGDSGGGGGNTPYNWTLYNGVWCKAIPWAYYNGAWHQAKPWVYSAGWCEPPTM